eukprot:scaffold27050_cov68-Phaeocystis_antarctica.AAC.1
MIWLSDPQGCHEATLSRCSTTALYAGSYDGRSATPFFRTPRALKGRDEANVRKQHVLHLAYVSDALRSYVSHHLSHARGVAGLHLTHEVAQQRACIVRSPVAANHREEHDGNLIQCRLPHLQQAPGSRQDALCGEDDEDIRLVDAYHTRREEDYHPACVRAAYSTVSMRVGSQTRV